MKKIRIESDGMPGGTKCFSEDGVEIPGVRAVRFEHRARELPSIEMDIVFVEGHFRGNAKAIGPNGKVISKIIYEDGSVDEY